MYWSWKAKSHHPYPDVWDSLNYYSSLVIIFILLLFFKDTGIHFNRHISKIKQHCLVFSFSNHYKFAIIIQSYFKLIINTYILVIYNNVTGERIYMASAWFNLFTLGFSISKYLLISYFGDSVEIFACIFFSELVRLASII